ncbi:WYL domain-containing protein [Leptospirillum ferriphilum]|uniref:WYL domain-containing protein n=1 Tax=Leptospirillum ferriphilum TaxID=178606 RepID=UPI003EE7733E
MDGLNPSREFTNLDSESWQPKVVRWGQDRRLEFIEFRLLWEGKINRSELVDFFGISIQQASLDFAKYLALARGNMEYDRSEKVYRATSCFEPRFQAPDTQAFLNQLANLTTGTLPLSLSFIGSRPPCDIVTLPTRRVRTDVLLAVLWAIRDHSEIEVTYQSMRRPSATKRWIAPHSLAFDGARWHMRSWCHDSSMFRDFVLTRVQEIHARRPSEIDGSKDTDWHTYVLVVIEPRPDLTVGQRDSVMTDFGMQNGKLVKTIRRALVQYFVRHLQIDGPSATGQPIIWANREELKDLVDPKRLY